MDETPIFYSTSPLPSWAGPSRFKNPRSSSSFSSSSLVAVVASWCKAAFSSVLARMRARPLLLSDLTGERSNASRCLQSK